MEILICTDVSNSSIQSGELISKLGFSATPRIVLLGVSENRDDVEKLTLSMEKIDKSIGAPYIITKKFRYGDPIVEILAEALEFPYDFVAASGGGKQLGLLHPQLGSTINQLARKLHTHLLLVHNITKQYGKILVCAGVDAPASETTKLGGEWISKTTAQVGLLHVVALNLETPKNNLKNDVSSKNAPGGLAKSYDLVLERAKQQLRKVEVKNQIEPRIRHGLVVEEVLKELSEWGYELLVVGAHNHLGQDRRLGTLLDDVADQLLNRSACSVFTI